MRERLMGPDGLGGWGRLRPDLHGFLLRGQLGCGTFHEDVAVGDRDDAVAFLGHEIDGHVKIEAAVVSAGGESQGAQFILEEVHRAVGVDDVGAIRAVPVDGKVFRQRGERG